ncbi:MAG: EF-hand domain-containing protein [Pseudomonadota bacterium]
MKLTVSALSITTSVALTAAASAQEGPVGRDTDGDGFISRAEVSAQAQQRFQSLDTNGDGIISFEEYETVSQTAFDRLDTNGDDLLSREELEAGRAQRGERRGRGRGRRGN